MDSVDRDVALDEARKARDALAEEGYRVLAADTLAFAEAAWPLAMEVWPEWDATDPNNQAE